MESQANRNNEAVPDDCPHPNDVDRKRIERVLAGRERYRYVTPVVRPAQRGYRIESPCCSRNIDENGGTIDIARIEYLSAARVWRLYRRDHLRNDWDYYADYPTLAALLNELNQDQERKFWQ